MGIQKHLLLQCAVVVSALVATAATPASVYITAGQSNADKTLPFIFGTVPHDSKQYSSEVEAAQMRVASELPNVYAIDLSDAGLRGDAFRWSSQKWQPNYDIEVTLANL
ncbi:MAG: hypothetical protein LUD17_02940 [Bacteroidales bacterium]|nr:hypothetical protein [Bacteroidales bacterium]